MFFFQVKKNKEKSFKLDFLALIPELVEGKPQLALGLSIQLYLRPNTAATEKNERERGRNGTKVNSIKADHSIKE